MSVDNEALQNLRSHLAKLPPGAVLDVKGVADLLSDSWASLNGGDATNMRADKLRRIEQPEWQPPILEFTIERHGQTVNGSSRATAYRWRVNVQEGTAEIAGEKRRQLYATDARLDVKPIAEAVADAIINGRNDARFSIGKDGTARLMIAEIIPATNKQTTSARRSRFRKHLGEILAPHGWKELRVNVFHRPE